MRYSSVTVTLLFLLTSLSWQCNQETEKVASQPNVIFILADDLGYETMTVNGGESYSTPNIDRMAAQGMRFEHCYAQPQCTPSRAQFLTGIYNVRNYINFGYVDTFQVTIAQLFRNAGYETGVAGKWQLGKNRDNPHQLGFNDYLVWQLTEGRVDSNGRDNRYSEPVLDLNGQVKTYASDDYGPDVINQFSLDFIDKNSGGEKPFFLFYSMMLVHCPFSPTPDSPEWMKDDTAVMEYKGQAHYFDDMVSYMDKMVGNLLTKVDELGIAENTLIVFVGDNGTDLPIVSRFKGKDVAGAKLESTDAGTRVPLIVKWPGKIGVGTVNSDLIDFTDFMPTLLAASDLQVPDSLGIDGVSFWPQLSGQAGTPRDWVYSWFLNPIIRGPKVFARNHQYKLYETGEFYDVPADDLEKHPISLDSLSDAQRMVYHELNQVITGYAKRRLDAIREDQK